MEDFWEKSSYLKKEISTVQINLGNLCNLNCKHCHIQASPHGDKNMNFDTAQKIVDKLNNSNVTNVEFTGGEPVLNSCLEFFIEKLAPQKKLSVRTNLVSLDNKKYKTLIEYFKKYKVSVIGSLPAVFEQATNEQRGNSVFEKSIKVLKDLNQNGYGEKYELDLVYNPTGDFLPPDSKQLDSEYRSILKEKYNITFNNLIAIVNVPITKYREHLEEEGTLDSYENELKEKFNPANVDKVMCRNFISIDFQGYMYDCDFNLAVNKKIKGYEEVKFWDVDLDNFVPEITFDNYCYACTVNDGSSCHGTLVKDNDVIQGDNIKDSVKEYYGDILSKSEDLKTSACCTLDSIPDFIKDSLKYVNDEIKMKYYGCGSPIPMAMEGLRTLDVGCGTGRDVYITSKLIGESGYAYGIDMTENQLQVAKKYLKEQMNIFEYKEPNVEFIHDYMENMDKHILSHSLDLVTSNCVINLAVDKELVLSKIYSLLRTGGEFYFSDIYADRRVPEEIAKDEILYGECLGGALYYKDFERMAKKVGFADPRVITSREVTMNNKEIENLVGNIKFYSVTYRLWKLDRLEDACEDYGHVVIYKGGIPFSPFKCELDKDHIFYKNKPERVCGNTVKMISETRFKKYFEIIGTFNEHFGEFEDCAGDGEKNDDTPTSGGCC